MFLYCPRRHWWVRGRPAVCVRPVHQYRGLLPVSVLPGIPAHTGGQPLWRHERMPKAFIHGTHSTSVQLFIPTDDTDSLFFTFSLDINECERPSNCQRGRCINSMGSYHCECQKGYMLIGGRRCQGQLHRKLSAFLRVTSNGFICRK